MLPFSIYIVWNSKWTWIEITTEFKSAVNWMKKKERESHFHPEISVFFSLGKCRRFEPLKEIYCYFNIDFHSTGEKLRRNIFAELQYIRNSKMFCLPTSGCIFPHAI